MPISDLTKRKNYQQKWYQKRIADKAAGIERPDARLKHNWAAIQVEYEAGATFSELRNKYGFCNSSWSKAIDRGQIMRVRRIQSTLTASFVVAESELLGQKVEAVVLADLVKRNYDVLVPFGRTRKYDLVVDVGGKFIRVQCKSGCLRGNVIHVSTSAPRRKSHYRGLADVFAIWCQQLDKIYYMDVDKATITSMSLRTGPCKSGQQRNVRMASDYEKPPF